MVIDVSPEHPRNAWPPMVVTVLGITVPLHPTINVLDLVLIMALQLFAELYVGFPSSTMISSRLRQEEKAELSILVTELGMVTEVNPSHT